MEELNEWREYDALRGGLDFDKLGAFFLKRPQLITARLLYVSSVLRKAKDEWENGIPDPAFDSSNAPVYQFDYVPEDEMDDGVRDPEDRKEEVYRGTRLVERMSSLGPVAVKICQTLSQRGDIVGDEVCNALKRLQTNNLPYDDDLAMCVIQESLRWDGPIAPNVNGAGAGNASDKTLFAYISPKPIAAASLGQVYRGTLHDGREVAIKVQRPDGMALLAQDAMSFRTVLGILNKVISLIPGRAFDSGLITDIVERVARDMTDELNYHKEALSGAKFAESLRFLGFVRTPNVIPEYSTDRVLVTEWIKGQHLSKLPLEDGLSMTRMAVEACTASLVLTGFVHADPHEGNLMLDEHGQVVFLDFGLMSVVEDDVMEAFAQGIQACLSEDWTSLTKAFKSSGFISNPIEWKPSGEESDEFVPVGYDPVTGEDLGIAELSKELGDAMRSEEGGTSRFGALATVLNNRLSARWKMATPPYVLLLIRTFLTLEGIAGRVDPNFNIYEMAMPWAIRRSLSPSTRDGITTLKNAVLTPDDRIQWSRLLDFLDQDDATEATQTDTPTVTKTNEDTKSGAMNDAVVTLIGSPEGAVLRRLIRDLDSIDLVARLLSRDAKPLRKQAVEALFAKDITKSTNKHEAVDKIPGARPMSNDSLQLRERQFKWTKKISRMLLQEHLIRQFKAGPKAWLKIIFLSLKITAGMLNQRLRSRLGRIKNGLFGIKPATSTD